MSAWHRPCWFNDPSATECFVNVQSRGTWPPHSDTVTSSGACGFARATLSQVRAPESDREPQAPAHLGRKAGEAVE